MSHSVTLTKPTNISSSHERSHSEIMFVMTALMLALFLAALDQTIVATALPRIASDLNGLNKISWVATAYLLTSAISTPLYGKIGDLFGRKKIFQISIIIFLAGSALCGLSTSMNELVLFRAIQGIGAGGLVSLVLAIIGDVVSPRQRGRYQGYFGGVFGIASVLGPLAGGFLADAHTILGVAGWRWIFYINLPIGILALFVIAARLHLPVLRREHKIDYIGAITLSISSAALILVSVWAGVTYAWSSWQIEAMLALGIMFGIIFVINERHVSEPIIPINLFRQSIFKVSILLSFLTGIIMFAVILYIPEYQQIVRGYSPIKSGLLTVPLVIGLFIASLLSGRLISKYGHYRPFPILGTIFIIVGLWLFTGLGLTTSEVSLALWMTIIGFGLGLFMQVPTLAVQNSIPFSQMGAGTATATFARSIGSSFGGAIFGTVLIARLNGHLKDLLPPIKAGAINASTLSGGTASLRNIAAPIRHDVLQAFALSFHDMFIYALPLGALALMVAIALKESPLRDTAKDLAEGESFRLSGPDL